ncbi:MAG TPA: aldo/keto reductase [Candidatus Saccharimonadales bacterium]
MADTISAARAGTIRVGDVTVNRLGLGTNRITDTDEAYQLLEEAVNLGVNFIDTAHRYQGGASETAIGNALAPYKNGLVVATKGGWSNTLPDQLRGLLEESLQRLQTKRVDLYQLHRVNPSVPIEESVAVLKELQDEGKIRHIGLSEVSIEQLKKAQEVAPIVSVQNEYNVAVRQHEALVDYCTEQNIVFIPWFPLGGLSGDTTKVEALVAEVAKKYHATAQQIALAWLLKRSPIMLPIPGTLSIDHLKDNLRAADLELSDEDYEALRSSTVAD